MRIALMTMLLIVAGVSYTQENWLTNFDEAKKVAEKEGKTILMSFSGSDWCGNCMRLDKELFHNQAFKVYSNENLVLLNLDFPAKKKNKLSPEQTKHNEELAGIYNKKGVFPTVVLVKPNGDVIGNMAHPKKSAEAYIENIKSQL